MIEGSQNLITHFQVLIPKCVASKAVLVKTNIVILSTRYIVQLLQVGSKSFGDGEERADSSWM